MTELDEQGRPEPPPAADENDTLLGFLEYQRATLAWKSAGLDTAGLSATDTPQHLAAGALRERRQRGPERRADRQVRDDAVGPRPLPRSSRDGSFSNMKFKY
jgi:hypothetical protein